MIRLRNIRPRRKTGAAAATAPRRARIAIAAGVIAAGILGFLPLPALAHPHVLITAHSEIAFDPQGDVTGITNVWDFDDAFSAFAIQGYDKNGDGILTRQELQPLAEVNLKSLADYGYFTKVTLGGANAAFGHPKDYFDVFNDEKLTLHFTLPLAKPLDVHGKAFQLDVYDPEYFAAITFAQNQPVRFVGNGTDCQSAIHRPKPLDPSIASVLSTIPASQRTLPPELFAITNKLINGAMVTCK